MRIIQVVRKHKKFLGALLTTAGGLVTAACTDDRVTANEWQMIGWTIAGAIVVYMSRNDEPPTTPESEETPRDGVPIRTA